MMMMIMMMMIIIIYILIYLFLHGSTTYSITRKRKQGPHTVTKICNYIKIACHFSLFVYEAALADMLVVAFQIPPPPFAPPTSHSPSLFGPMFLPSVFYMYVHFYLFGGGVGGGLGGHCWSAPRYIPRSYQGASTTTEGGGGGEKEKSQMS